jgi:hypothetical protein
MVCASVCGGDCAVIWALCVTSHVYQSHEDDRDEQPTPPPIIVTPAATSVSVSTNVAPASTTAV